MTLSQHLHDSSQTISAPARSSMTQPETESVLSEYLDALISGGDFARFFADQIVVTLIDLDQRISGRQAAQDAITQAHCVAFDAKVAFSSVVVGAGIASAEAVFVGTHISDFAGIPATGRDVRVPYAVFWELEEGQITSLKLYGPMSGIIQQLTA
jgi:predicted ester cyclase